jgi:hypothetical protein
MNKTTDKLRYFIGVDWNAKLAKAARELAEASAAVRRARRELDATTAPTGRQVAGIRKILDATTEKKYPR